LGRGLLPLASCLKDRLEIPRQQRLDRLHRRGQRQLLEHLTQVFKRLEPIGTRRHHEREQIGAGLGANLVITEHPQFSTESVLLDLALDEVIVYGDIWVLEDQNQLRPLPLTVCERFAQRTVRWSARQ